MGLPSILMAYCNSHARRGFKMKLESPPPEAEFMVDQYRSIYTLEATAKGQCDEVVLETRSKMLPYFERMKSHAQAEVNRFSSKSSIAQAFNYFINNYPGLTVFLTDPGVPIDNNPSERLLRGPVVGRKTWYGTHSRRGAEAAAIHHSLIEASKLNGISPRLYYEEIIKRTHAKQPLITPKAFVDMLNSNTPPPETS